MFVFNKRKLSQNQARILPKLVENAGAACLEIEEPSHTLLNFISFRSTILKYILKGSATLCSLSFHSVTEKPTGQISAHM